jgi:aerobic carbon-monoxide dehydrogenase medium subunit
LTGHFRSLVYKGSRGRIGGRALKPSRFVYHRTQSIDEAVTALATWAPEGGRVLAGGQSLLPMMAFRLAQPPHLIDINRIAGLDRIACEAGTLRIPACARHAAFERPVVPGALGIVLARIAAHIAHHPIRTRGTFCGSIAHADPASEWCVAAVALDAQIVARSARGERLLRADEFFMSAMTTALPEDELLVETRLPIPPPDTRFGFDEHSRRAGDFALSMTLAALRLVDGRIADARVALGGAEARPRRLALVESVLQGAVPGNAIATRAADVAADSVDAMEDGQTCASLRRDLVRATTRRALLRALA